MSEKLFEFERKMSVQEIAEYLGEIASKMESGQEISLSSGNRSIEVKPEGRPEFEVSVEKESRRSGPDEMSLELEIEWREGGESSNSDLEIK